MSNRFHSKYHRTNHHTYGSDIVFGTPTNPDSGHDPIASPEHPFKGDFCLRGGLSASVPSQSAYAAAFMGNLLLTGSFVMDNDILNINYPNSIVGINIDPIYPINYRTQGDFDLVVNKNANFLQNITTSTLSADQISTDYIRVDISNDAVDYPVFVRDKEDNFSYLLIDKSGSVGINLGQSPNLENKDLKVQGSTLFDAGSYDFEIKGSTYINHSVNSTVTKIATNTNAGNLTMGRDEFVLLNQNKQLSANGDVVFVRNLNLSGNAIFGNIPSEDTFVITSRIASDIIPNTNNRNLGDTTLPWNNIYFRSLSGGNGTFEGNLQLSGNAIFGNDASADTIVVTSRVASDIVPNTNNTRNLGSLSLPWNNLYFRDLSGTNGTYTNDLQVSGNTTLGTDGASDNLIITSRVASDIIPNTHNTRNLGAPSLPWNNFYFRTLSGTSGIYTGNVTINGDLTVLGETSQLDTIINTTSSVRVENNGTQIALYVEQKGATADVVNFVDNNASCFYIKDGGNVGINTTTPNQKLTVNGSISSTDKIYLANSTYFEANGASTITTSPNSTLRSQGNSILGSDVNTNTIQVLAKFSSNILPSATQTIGTNSTPWNYGYFTSLSGLNGAFPNLKTTQTVTDLSEDDLVINKSQGDIRYKNFEDSVLDANTSDINSTTPVDINTNFKLTLQAHQTFEITSIINIQNMTSVVANGVIRFRVDNQSGITLFRISDLICGSSISQTQTGGISWTNNNDVNIPIAANGLGYLRRTIIIRTNNNSQVVLIPQFATLNPSATYQILSGSYITKRRIL